MSVHFWFWKYAIQSHCEDAFKNRNYNCGRNIKVSRGQKKYKKETSDVLKRQESDFQISD